MEEWRDIKGYEGKYQVSNLGKVRSLKNKNILEARILKQYKRYGYCLVHLSLKGIEKNKRVHRLVAEAFIPNPYKLPHVNHKDFDRENNKVENLEWCTQDYNNKYSMLDSRRKVKLTNDIYIKICDEYSNGEYVTDLAKKYNVDQALISRILRKNNINRHEKKANNKLRQRKIVRLTTNDKKIDEWESISKASKTLNINNGHIVDVCKGKRKTAGGYKWKYKGVEKSDFKRS